MIVKTKGDHVIKLTEEERRVLNKLRDAPKPAQLKVIKALQRWLREVERNKERAGTTWSAFFASSSASRAAESAGKPAHSKPGKRRKKKGG